MSIDLSKAIFTFLIFFQISILSGQVILDENQIPVDPKEYHNLSTPYNTTLTFFYNLRADNYEPEAAAKTLFSSSKERVEAAKLAVKLKQIFDGKGIYVRLNEVPNEPNYADSVNNNQARYFFDAKRLPSIYLEKEGRQWKFSAFSVSQIEELHKETYPFGTGKLLNVLPKLGNQVYFGLQFWQLAGILILTLMLFVFHKVITFLVDRGLLHVLERFNYGETGEKYLLPLARITSIYFVIMLLSLFIKLLQLPIEVVSWITMLLSAAKPFIITLVFYKIVGIIAVYFSRLASKTDSTLDDQLVPLVRKTVKAFVVIVGTLYILKEGLEIDILPFLTGLSIGGLAFALAAQDTIKNFFGSIMIFIDKPFQVGDWITSGDVDGTVEEVGFRSTRIRTFRDSVMYIPNGKIADATIDNHGLRQYRRFYTTLTITYDTPPALVEAFVNGLREIVIAHPDTRKEYFNIYFNNLSAYSLDVMFYVFFRVPDWAAELKARHELLIRILKLANELGVRFAFPTQTLHMETFPEKKSMVPEYPQDAAGYQLKLQEFMKNEFNKKDLN